MYMCVCACSMHVASTIKYTLLYSNVATLGQIQENKHVPYTQVIRLYVNMFFSLKTPNLI
jgi:hypothetical protein